MWRHNYGLLFCNGLILQETSLNFVLEMELRVVLTGETHPFHVDQFLLLSLVILGAAQQLASIGCKCSGSRSSHSSSLSTAIIPAWIDLSTRQAFSPYFVGVSSTTTEVFMGFEG